ncbi:uncharacterized protein [Haliotis cracherodii]|uniref:uncharacterized protein n=1 Tax=Haliotis cracherodii TaxID=6455 RepID=UPI0039EA1057
MGCGRSTEQDRRPKGDDTGSSRARHSVTQVVKPQIRNKNKTKTTQGGIPNLPRPKKRKDDLIPDVSVFAKRDSWAKQVPDEHCQSVEDLARYLSHEAKQDLEKVRAFYKWMALNICYDTESFLTKKHVYPSDPKSVLKYRISVCDGYAQLFEALCKVVSVPCYYVAGFSKGTTYDPSVPITEDSFVNHAWNIVCINGTWWPVDVTWGAGQMDKSNRFVWNYNELNFLTDPDVFILAHYPYMEDSMEYSAPFQLLKTPITLDEFNLTVKPDRNGMEWGLELLSHTQGKIDVVHDVTINFRTSKVHMVNVSCTFHRKRSGQDYESNVILYKKDGIFSAKVKPPSEGTYKLMLFGETEGMSKHQGLVSYIINCIEADDNGEPYPEHFGMWGGQAGAVDCGFSEDVYEENLFLSEDGTLEFSLPVKWKVDNIIRLEHSQQSGNLDDFVSEATNSTTMAIMVRLPYSGYYKLQIFASDPNEPGSYNPVVFIFINCLKGMRSCSSFSDKTEVQRYLASESSKPRKRKKKGKTPPPAPSPEPDTESQEDEPYGDIPPSIDPPEIAVYQDPDGEKGRLQNEGRHKGGKGEHGVESSHVNNQGYGLGQTVLVKSRRGSTSSTASVRSWQQVNNQSKNGLEPPVLVKSRRGSTSSTARVRSWQQVPDILYDEQEDTMRYEPYNGRMVEPVKPEQFNKEVEEDDEEEDDEYDEGRNAGGNQPVAEHMNNQRNNRYVPHQGVHRAPVVKNTHDTDEEEPGKREVDEDENDNEYDLHINDDKANAKANNNAHHRANVNKASDNGDNDEEEDTEDDENEDEDDDEDTRPKQQRLSAVSYTGYVDNGFYRGPSPVPSHGTPDYQSSLQALQIQNEYQGGYVSPSYGHVDPSMYSQNTLPIPYQQAMSYVSPSSSMTDLNNPQMMARPRYSTVARPY